MVRRMSETFRDLELKLMRGGTVASLRKLQRARGRGRRQERIAAAVVKLERRLQDQKRRGFPHRRITGSDR